MNAKRQHVYMYMFVYLIGLLDSGWFLIDFIFLKNTVVSLVLPNHRL